MQKNVFYGLHSFNFRELKKRLVNGLLICYLYKDFNFASFYWINMNMKEHIKLPEIWCIMTMVEIFV